MRSKNYIIKSVYLSFFAINIILLVFRSPETKGYFAALNYSFLSTVIFASLLYILVSMILKMVNRNNKLKNIKASKNLLSVKVVIKILFIASPFFALVGIVTGSELVSLIGGLSKVAVYVTIVTGSIFISLLFVNLAVFIAYKNIVKEITVFEELFQEIFSDNFAFKNEEKKVVVLYEIEKFFIKLKIKKILNKYDVDFDNKVNINKLSIVQESLRSSNPPISF